MSKVLVVVDMQNGFEPAKEIDESVAKYIHQKRDEGYDIVFTQDKHYGDFRQTKEGHHYVPHCLCWDFAEYGFTPAIAKEYDLERDLIVEKDTFGSLELINNLLTIDAQQRTEEILICGVVASVCVTANAILIASAFPNIPVVVLWDLCNDFERNLIYNKVATRPTLNNMLIKVTDTEQWEKCRNCSDKSFCIGATC